MCSTPKSSTSPRRRSAAGDYAPVFTLGTGEFYKTTGTSRNQRPLGDYDRAAAATRTKKPGEIAARKSFWRRIKDNLAANLR
ncbi:MAG: hypothetical protein OET44_07610 [Gammaproteobacteria bacterium]|nr:hypothetical protein [Gammaproteobacteria bacterium]